MGTGDDNRSERGVRGAVSTWNDASWTGGNASFLYVWGQVEKKTWHKRVFGSNAERGRQTRETNKKKTKKEARAHPAGGEGTFRDEDMR